MLLAVEKVEPCEKTLRASAISPLNHRRTSLKIVKVYGARHDNVANLIPTKKPWRLNIIGKVPGSILVVLILAGSNFEFGNSKNYETL